MIILDQGTDTELGIVGLGYSSDNGTHFFVTNTIRGRVFRKQDIETLWPLLKDKIQSVMDGSLSVSWADIQNKPDVATQEDLKNIELKPGPQGHQGLPGKDGVTPHIDSTTGDWFIGNQDTGTQAQGPAGKNGRDGVDGQPGKDGQNGITPHIDTATGNWFIGSTDTGIKAQGQQGNPGKDGAPGPANVRLSEADTRNDNNPPSWYMYQYPKSIVTEFKSTAKIGVNSILTGFYCNMTTITSWSDGSGGLPVQISTSSDNNGLFAYRVAISGDAWGDWQQMGARGPKGEKGDPGKDGQNGIPGTNGKNGADGKSTYQIWLDNGHTGTETDFLNSLKGAKGDPGKDGKDGESPDPSIFATKNEVQKAQSVADDAAKYARNNAQLIKQANDRIDAIKIPDTSDFVTSNDLISVRNTASSAQETAREAQSVANSASSIASSAYSLASSANSKASQLENKINQMGKIDSSSQYSNKTPSEYSDGIFYEEKYISTMGIDRSSLDNSAQSGTYGLVTTKVMTINGTKYARQQCEVMDSQRPITFLRNGYSNSWSSWEVNTTLAF